MGCNGSDGKTLIHCRLADRESGGRPWGQGVGRPRGSVVGGNNTSPIKAFGIGKILQWFNEVRMTNPAEKIFRTRTTV